MQPLNTYPAPPTTNCTPLHPQVDEARKEAAYWKTANDNSQQWALEQASGADARSKQTRRDYLDLSLQHRDLKAQQAAQDEANAQQILTLAVELAGARETVRQLQKQLEVKATKVRCLWLQRSNSAAPLPATQNASVHL